MGITLFDWQIPAYNRTKDILTQYNFCIQASDCGTGKTVIILQACKDLGLKPLIVCPRSVITSWRRTADIMNVPVVDVITPQRLLHKNKYHVSGKWDLTGIDMCVYDEVHGYASGIDAKSARILAELKAYPVKVTVASATLLNSPLQMRAVGFLAGICKFERGAYLRWCLSMGCYKMPMIKALRFNGGRDVMQKIAQDLSPYMVRIDSTKVEKFPKSLVVPKLMDLDDVALEELNAIYAAMDQKLKEDVHTNPLVANLRERQRIEQLKTPLVMELVQEAVDEGYAPVVLLNFRASVAAVREAAAAKGITSSIIIGEQSQAERDGNIDEFQSDKTMMMVGTLAAGGAGINLNCPKDSGLKRRVSFINPGWDAAALTQGLGRIHRASNDDVPVIQTLVLCSNSIEERVYRSIQAKIGRIQDINNADLGAPAL